MEDEKKLDDEMLQETEETTELPEGEVTEEAVQEETAEEAVTDSESSEEGKKGFFKKKEKKDKNPKA